MIHKIPILVGQNIGVRNEIIMLSSKLFLHFDIVKAESIFLCNLVRAWEMVDSLVLIEPLIKVLLASATGPEKVPLMRLSVSKPIGLAHGSDQLGIPLENLVKQVAVVDVESLLSMPV